MQSQGVGTSVKHFAVNNQEDDRLRVSADVDERTLREIYLPAFERIAKAGAPWTVMCGYNKINGVYCSENHWLLDRGAPRRVGMGRRRRQRLGRRPRPGGRRCAAVSIWEMPPDLERSPASGRGGDQIR